MYVGMIIAAATITWEGASVFFQAGQILLLVAGSALETAIGTSNIANVSSRGAALGGPGQGSSN